MTIMEKSFIHCAIDVVSLVILVPNEKLVSSCPTKINMNVRGSSIMDKSNHLMFRLNQELPLISRSRLPASL